MADGAIKIITKIGTEGFEKGKKRLEEGMRRLEDSMGRLANSTFGVDKAASRAFESSRLKAQDTEIAISQVEKKMQEVREASIVAGAEGSNAFKKAKQSVDDTSRALSELYAKRDALAEEKVQKAFGDVFAKGADRKSLPSDFADRTIQQDSDIKAMDKQIDRVEARLETYKSKMNAAKEAGAGLTDEAERELKSLQRKLDGLNTRLLQYRKRMEDAKNGTSGFSGIVDKAKKSFKGLFDESKRTEKQMGRTGKMIERMISRMLIFAAIALIMKSISEGFQNMAQASGSANQVLSNLTTSFLYLKNSLASALMPTLQALSPMIIMITDNLASLFNMIGMVTARVFGGATTFTKAKKAQVDYAASLNKTGKEAKKAAGALAAFDEINVLQKKEDTGGGGTPGMPAPGEMFEEAQIPQETLAFADKIKDLFNQLKVAAQPTIDAFKRLWDALVPFKNFAWTALKDFYEEFLKPVGGWMLGIGIPQLVDAFREGLEKVNWERINENLSKLWKALAPFAIHVGEGLLWFWKNVLLPLGTWTLNNVVPRFLEGLSYIIQILDGAIQKAQPAFLWLWNEFLKPAAEWTGDFLLDGLDTLIGILEAVAGLLNGDMKQAADGAGKAFNGFGKIIEDVFIQILGKEAVEAIKTFVKEWSERISKWWMADVKPWFTKAKWMELFDAIRESFLDKWQEINEWWSGGFIVTFIEDYVKPWFARSKWTEIFSPIKDSFMEKWNDVTSWWTTALSGWWESHVKPWFTKSKWVGIMSGVKEGFAETFYNAVEAARNLFNKFIDWLNSKMNFSWDTFKIAGKTIVSSGSIQLFTIPPIPKLATGAVIPPNSEFLAVLGDQRHGRNLEAPEGLIEEIVNRAVSNALEGFGGGETTIRFEGSMGQLIRVMKPHIDKENNRRGKNLIKGAPAW